MESPQKRMQALSEDYQKLQEELQGNVSARQRLDAQKQENLSVQKEFKGLKDTETIFKLVGPVLHKQDKVEAENTVNGRLDFINKEIARLEQSIKETQEKMEKKKGEIISFQATAQQQAAAAAGGAQTAQAS